jgi:hypothetical protein
MTTRENKSLNLRLALFLFGVLTIAIVSAMAIAAKRPAAPAQNAKHRNDNVVDNFSEYIAMHKSSRYGLPLHTHSGTGTCTR